MEGSVATRVDGVEGTIKRLQEQIAKLEEREAAHRAAIEMALEFLLPLDDNGPACQPGGGIYEAVAVLTGLITITEKEPA